MSISKNAANPPSSPLPQPAAARRPMTDGRVNAASRLTSVAAHHRVTGPSWEGVLIVKGVAEDLLSR
jgi:hypothetical protein